MHPTNPPTNPSRQSEHQHDASVTSVGFNQVGDLDLDKTNSWIAKLLTLKGEAPSGVTANSLMRFLMSFLMSSLLAPTKVKKPPAPPGVRCCAVRGCFGAK